MLINSKQQHWIIEGITLLFILLFTYAGLSKILEFEVFRIQLGKSPFIGEYADLLAWGVPVIELLISFILFFPRLKLVGVWSSFMLMVIFTTYIVLVLNLSESIPCSCGGVIASLSWNQHLIFNIGFTLLAAFGVLLSTKNNEAQNL